MKKTDLRHIKTEEKINTVFIDLLQKVGFNKLTITLLIKEAGINRSTFYAHYLDKYDLLDKTIERVFEELYEILEQDSYLLLDKNADMSIHYRKIIHYCYEKRELLTLLLNHSMVSDFMGKLNQFLYRSWKSQNLDYSNIPENYLVVAISNLFASILVEWTKTDFKESEEELYTIFIKLFSGLKQSLSQI